MGSIRYTAASRVRAIRFAIIGNTVPVAIATATHFRGHHFLFFVGALGAAIAPLIVTAMSKRHRFLFGAAALGGIPALTLMQSDTGGVASPYSILVIMAMIWFGIQGTDRELLVGVAVFAGCAYLPMLLIGPPAFPIDWGHATLLVLIGTTVAGSLRVLTRETEMLTSRLRQEAVVDDLTDLLNRRGWRYAAPRELARAQRAHRSVVLVMLDLDRFKILNDTLGHQEGDRVLRETADRLRNTFRAGDIVARLGGDEFVVLLTNSSADGARATIERLRENSPAAAGFSAGIAVWDGSEDLTELLHRADRALYEAKASGAGRTDFAGRRAERELIAA